MQAEENHRQADTGARAEPRAPAVRLVGITKFFGGVRGLADVSLDLFGGEIVGLVGENGAGKSTLTKIISGVLTPDLGELWIGGEQVAKATPRRTRDLGVETVYQTLELCDNLTAPANVVLGQEPIRFRLGPLKFVDKSAMRSIAEDRLSGFGTTLPDTDVSVRRLSGGQRQAVAIARAMMRGSRLMTFDEPTAALGLAQTRATWELIRRVAERGIAVLLISHNVQEVLELADRVVALRHGKLTLDARTDSVTRDEVEVHMLGSRR
jgi:simple sugar transport system ATP-binding protein